MKKEAWMRTFGVAATIFVAVLFILDLHYPSVCPRVAAPHAGYIYALNLPGIVYYATKQQQSLRHALPIGAASCPIPFAFMAYLKIRRKKQGQSGK
jgi:hypothetical protein